MSGQVTWRQIVSAQRKQIVIQLAVIAVLVVVIICLLTALSRVAALPEGVGHVVDIVPHEERGPIVAARAEPLPYEGQGPDEAFIPLEIIRDISPAVELGQFTAYAYCSCPGCCGEWAGGPTATGVLPEVGRTVAVDPEVIPLGSLLLIDGAPYIAEDTGVSGRVIDIYHSSHAAAREFGVQTVEVWVVRGDG